MFHIASFYFFRTDMDESIVDNQECLSENEFLSHCSPGHGDVTVQPGPAPHRSSAVSLYLQHSDCCDFCMTTSGQGQHLLQQHGPHQVHRSSRGGPAPGTVNLNEGSLTALL